MTEKTVEKKWITKKRPGLRYLIDPRAFVFALIGAPILVTLLSLWLFFPVYALVLGGPIYLITATPVMLWWLGRHPSRTGIPALLAILVNLGVAGIIYLFSLVDADPGLDFIALLYLTFGSFFAPIWALTFEFLYHRFQRDVFAHPLQA